MAFYSSGDTATKYIDPKSFMDGKRAVFDLRGQHLAVLPNMRILDIGVFGQADGEYNQLVGVNSIIQEITLFDGHTILTQANNYALYRGFQLQNTTNSNAMSVQSLKNGNHLGYQEEHAEGLLDFQIDPVLTKATRDASGGSVIELSECLPMLRSITHLPTDTFNNLRLEITFNIDVNQQILSSIANTITGMKLPILAIDVLDNKDIVSKMTSAMGNSIGWLEIEHDQVGFPVSANDGGANDQGVVQVREFKLDGYRGKSVERMVQIKEIQDPAKYLVGNNVQGFGKYQSAALYEEKIEVNVNGAPLFPGSGLVGNMERLSMVVDTYGDCIAFLGSNQTDQPTEISVGFNAADGRQKRGNLSYNAWYIGQKVQTLQVRHSRTGLNDTTIYRPSTDALNVHYYGEVKKALVIGNKGYNIVYL